MQEDTYRELEVWQLGMDLATSIYELSRLFPQNEVQGLTPKMRQIAVSIPSNIAEGHSRDSSRKFLQCTSCALGALAELETLLFLAVSLDYCKRTQITPLLEKCEQGRVMLQDLHQDLKRNARF